MTNEERSNQPSTWTSAYGDAGEDCVCIHWNNVPRMVRPLYAGCAKNDSIEIIKRLRYRVLEMCNICPEAQWQDSVILIICVF